MDKNDLESLESGDEQRAKPTLQKFVEKVGQATLIKLFLLIKFISTVLALANI